MKTVLKNIYYLIINFFKVIIVLITRFLKKFFGSADEEKEKLKQAEIKNINKQEVKAGDSSLPDSNNSKINEFDSDEDPSQVTKDLEIFTKLYNMLDDIEDVSEIYHNVKNF